MGRRWRAAPGYQTRQTPGKEGFFQPFLFDIFRVFALDKDYGGLKLRLDNCIIVLPKDNILSGPNKKEKIESFDPFICR